MIVEQIGDCMLYNEDCAFILPMLQGVDAVVSDPPYGMDWNTDSRRFSGGQSEAIRRKPRGQGRDHDRVHGDSQLFDPLPWLRFPYTVLWGANHYAQQLPVGKTLVWVKRHPELFGSFLSDCEIGWASGGHGVYGHYFQFPPPVRAAEAGGDPSFPVTVHPTQKPLSLMVWCIEAFTKGPTILDPYMGSGTTGVACAKLGRRFIGIEREAKYFDIACRRIEDTYKQGDLFVSPPEKKPEQQNMFDGQPGG